MPRATPGCGRLSHNGTLPSLCDDVRVTEEILAGQVDYYRRRAGEYDATAYGDIAAARARIARLVARMRPVGRVLEIACGTGLGARGLAGAGGQGAARAAGPTAAGDGILASRSAASPG